ncbi:crotonase/enoyl-CoA hydratase family protein [Rhodovulum adriaticum]|uniref:Enoyl-CoA hydratase/carnithine racemase n=1 Tax=Rhodovulum adriaticum TaxID=35804 RepID=A0A4R2NIB1_RHOAD|nr:crotonase/enoyl-CoA hydratase family protein [Rhodovulum adriaticum]MBK1635384.1 enoyl-CoA hydratase [Rhodovulum adriaticum]TCP21090.1 enoyl-CoA hydratase/carnithine racemase [Rhodovulum adriaticum]
MTDKLLIAQEGAIATLTLNMPETRNALTDADLCDAVVDAMGRIAADQSVRCAILTGAGLAFSSGGNLKHMQEKHSIFAGDAIEAKDAYRTGIQRMARAIWHCEVPLIAAVNGPAYGAGCDLACMCDIRIAATNATFAENFARVGLISGDGGAWLLPRQIGLSRAAEMTFTADPIDADTALAWGLVSRVVAPEALLPEALDLAGRIARNPPRQLRMAKRLIREGMTTRLESVMELAAAYQGACQQTEDHAEAVDAILEKRPPVFSGR